LGAGGRRFKSSLPRPFKTMGYGLDRSPFFIVASTMGNKRRLNRIKSLKLQN